VSDTPKKTCGSCVHWENQKPYAWGLCGCPLPSWVELNGDCRSPILQSKSDYAEYCDQYQSVPTKEVQGE